MVDQEAADLVELLRALIAAFNRYDLDTAMSFFL